MEVNGQEWSVKMDELHEVIEKDAVVSIEGIRSETDCKTKGGRKIMDGERREAYYKCCVR